LALKFGPKAEIELLDRGGKRNVGLAQPALHGGVGTGRHLLFQHPLQKVGVAQLLLRRAFEPLLGFVA
jgi:hypothetical protein